MMDRQTIHCVNTIGDVGHQQNKWDPSVYMGL